MFILNLNVNFIEAFHISRNLSVFPIHSLIILKVQTFTLCVGALWLHHQFALISHDLAR